MKKIYLVNIGLAMALIISCWVIRLQINRINRMNMRLVDLQKNPLFYPPITETNEWYRQMHAGWPTAEQITNRICYAAQQWCQWKLRNEVLTYAYYTNNSKDEYLKNQIVPFVKLLHDAKENISFKRITNDKEASINYVYWGDVVHMSQSWYALPTNERESLGHRPILIELKHRHRH